MKICLTLKTFVCGLFYCFQVVTKARQYPSSDSFLFFTCRDGYYRIDNGCRQCLKECLTCNSRHDCTSCIAGYKGTYCQHCQDGFYRNKDGSCQQCLNECLACSNQYVCTSCAAGRNGTFCQYCKDGSYLNEGKCYQCNTNCQNDTCHYLSGECIYGCINGWSGGKCTDACARGCTSCQRSNNNSCSCSFGYYGTSCESKCSPRCVATDGARQCNETTGACYSGCVDGWTGSKCTEACDMNCISCDKHGTCLNECVIGYKGDRCDVPCDAGCSSGCYRKTGVCLSCKTAYFGPSCQQLCNATCYDPGNGSNVCQQLSGECLYDCLQLPCALDGTKDSKPSDDVAVICGVVGSAVMVVLVAAAVFGVKLLRKRRWRQVCRSKTETGEHINLKDMSQATSKNIDGMCRRNPGESRIHPQTAPASYDVEDGNIYEEIA